MEEHTHQPKKELLSTSHAVIIGSILISLSILFAGGVHISSSIDSVASGTASNGTTTIPEHLSKLAVSLKLSKKDFEKCLVPANFDDAINKSITEATQAGVNGTPTSFIIAADGTQMVITGAQPYEVVKAAIDQALAGTLPKGKQVNLRPVDNTDMVTGNPNAPVTMIEYSDLQCPFCIQFHPTVQKILAAYPNQIRFVYRHFPLSFHANARIFATAANCANELGGSSKFFEMVDAIFSQGPSWN